MVRKYSSNGRLQLPCCRLTNIILGHETATTFLDSVSNYLMEQMVREPTGANAALSFVLTNVHDLVLALPMEAPLYDHDHRELRVTSSSGAPQARYSPVIVLNFKKSYARNEESC